MECENGLTLCALCAADCRAGDYSDPYSAVRIGEDCLESMLHLAFTRAWASGQRGDAAVATAAEAIEHIIATEDELQVVIDRLKRLAENAASGDVERKHEDQCGGTRSDHTTCRGIAPRCRICDHLASRRCDYCGSPMCAAHFVTITDVGEMCDECLHE